MASGHAVSGGALWLTGWAGAALLGAAHPGLDVVVIGTLMTAGGALYPDFDHPHSRIATHGGLFTRAVAGLHAFVGKHVHAATKTDTDRPDEDGHRVLTHTFVFAVFVGLIVSALAGGAGAEMLEYLVGRAAGVGGPAWQRYAGWLADTMHGHYGPVVVGALVYFFVSLGAGAALDVLPEQLQRWRLGKGRFLRKSTAVAAVAAVLAGVLVGGDTWWLGLAVGVGCAAHCLGDSITASGCPFLWPVPVPSTELRFVRGRGKVPVRVWRTWYLFGTPQWMRFRVGSDTETLVTWCLVLLGLVAAGGLVYARVTAA